VSKLDLKRCEHSVTRALRVAGFEKRRDAEGVHWIR
jgi:hypothetical protein